MSTSNLFPVLCIFPATDASTFFLLFWSHSKSITTQWCAYKLLQIVVLGGHVSSSYEIDATRELVAIGIANIAGGIFSSLPSQAPLARSAINSASGAKTQVSLLVGRAVQRMLSRDTPVAISSSCDSSCI